MIPEHISTVNPPVQNQEPPDQRRAATRLRTLAAAAVSAWIAAAIPCGAWTPGHQQDAVAGRGAAVQAPAQPGGSHDEAAQPAGGGQASGPAARGEAQVVVAGEAHAAGTQEGHGEEHESESPWGLVGRIFNFAVLAGALVYLLRSPLVSYLRTRAVNIRADLTKAAELRDAAARQISQIDARMRALPDEIKALAERGAEEIAAEEARILATAESERLRMLEQARREIDLQVRLAERTLRRRAAELAVDIATERVRRSINDADHARLVDRYLAQVGSTASGQAKGLPS